MLELILTASDAPDIGGKIGALILWFFLRGVIFIVVGLVTGLIATVVAGALKAREPGAWGALTAWVTIIGLEVAGIVWAAIEVVEIGRLVGWWA